ncbi:ParB/RepB/Spo0J family partition protein [Paenibacillus polymyxa]|uniref:ParB/RepB/Spo0J family partition protein n=1 Tax=Paenibacillus polymyxa TaxID=1406 RepID=UPI002AB3B8A7|nr:ParB/RepB/Spo0J family partition protein [Paenibacillus polymyxa]MDY8024827.1 ParB/RepB/Spo0J family partition protein [Paenibacillus polymyxa]
MKNTSRLIMADIKDVIPNPFNPRTNNAIKTEEIQRVIKEKGWEVPITCYQKGSQYIILSGHRRWYAAKKLAQKKLPVYLVEAPASIEEEQERLGSVQGGKSDWTVYEWAKHTYEMWIYWDKCSFNELARKMNRSCAFVSPRVKIFSYYPHSEIESKLKSGKYSISGLSYLIKWLDSLSRLKPEIVEHLTIDMIRTTMLSKIEKGLVGILDLKSDLFIHQASNEQISDFLMNSNKKLSDAFLEVSKDSIKYRGKSKIKAQLHEIDNANDIIKRLNPPESAKELKKMQHMIDEYNHKLLSLKEDLRTYMNNETRL